MVVRRALVDDCECGDRQGGEAHGGRKELKQTTVDVL